MPVARRRGAGRRRGWRSSSSLTSSRSDSPWRARAWTADDDPVGRRHADVGARSAVLRAPRPSRRRPAPCGARARRRAARSRRTGRPAAAPCGAALPAPGRTSPSRRFYHPPSASTPLRPEHQLLERGARRLAPVEHRRHLRGDRQLDAVRARRAPARPRSSSRPRPPSSCRRGSRQAAAARQFDADVPVAAEGPVHVSTRSPSPVRPASVSRRPPAAHASREISTRPRVMSAACAL